MAGSIAFWGSGVETETTLSNGAGDKLRTINETYASHPWDRALVANIALPGICAVLDGLTEIGIDNKNPDGKDGSAITVKGYRPGPFVISCTVWTEEQWEILQGIIGRVWRRPEKRAKVADVAIAVHHPALELYGIASAVLQGMTFPRDVPFDGAKTIHFKFLENFAPGAKRQTKTASEPETIPQYNPYRQAFVTNAVSQPPSKDRKKLGPGGPPKPPGP